MKQFIGAPVGRRIPGWISRYVFAAGVSLLALILSRLVSPYMDSHFFDLFQGAVVLAAWYGGLGPGILASGMAILLLDYFFMPPYHSLSLGVTDIFRLTIFGAVAVLTSSLSNQLKQAKAELEEAHEKLEDRIARRTLELSHANDNLVAEIAHRVEAERAILDVSHREQRRLGQDLHDGLCQILAGVRLLGDELKEKLLLQESPYAKDIELIDQRLSDALAQADTVSRGLYPVELEHHGLGVALEELAANMSRVSRTQVRFRYARQVNLHNGPVATHLYRIAQEAVANAIKSGKAKKISIRLQERRSRLTISITDDGVGMNPYALRNGMGLKMMRYRASVIDSSIRWRSRSKGCTRVLCTLRSAEFGKEEEVHGQDIRF